jgi:hypothetical protein
MKTVYICGDSFAVADPEYGASWPELLANLLIDQARVVNLSSVAASNLLINIQANLAVQLADYIIVLATAVTRAEVAVQAVNTELTLLERFQRNDLVAYSILRPYRSYLTTQEQQLVRQYHTEFFDLDLAIHRDHAIISNTLDIVQASGRPYLFDQGGFEHPGFGGTRKYFAQARRSAINLWDLGTTQDERPYYHIKELEKHERIARYYYNDIIKHL